MWENVVDRLWWRHTWYEMALLGHCDEIDSAEYDRITEDWLGTDRHGSMRDFIQVHANRCPFIHTVKESAALGIQHIDSGAVRNGWLEAVTGGDS